MGIYADLKRAFPSLALEEGFSLARHTTVGCGGTVDAAAFPSSSKETALLIRFLRSEGIPYAVLGAGANTLAEEGRLFGVVVKLRMNRLTVAEGNILADGGVTGGALLRFARERGLGGLEHFAGIPMTVGGAICMNAGIRAGYFGERVKRVLALIQGEMTVLKREECAFGVKSSVFLRDDVILRAELSVRPSSKDAIFQAERHFLSARSHLPKGRSTGCSFVNPKGISAGALIEVCGLKGARRGGAVVSDRHANFILNEGKRICIRFIGLF